MNLIAGAAHRLAAAVGPEADLCVGGDPLPRLDAVWLQALAHAGTIHVPPRRLRQAARLLDVGSFGRVLVRCRRGGRGSLRVDDSGAGPSAEGAAVSFDYYSPAAAGLAVPYGMHPGMYAAGLAGRARRLRPTPRRFRLVFAGSSGVAYRQVGPFQLLPRPDVLDCLVGTFRPHIQLARRREELPGLARTDRPIAVVLSGQTGGPADARLPPGEYLRLVASADFALCPPGLTVPHSHNLVEALAVGTVPVTNYYMHCRPPLDPGRNCLGFDSPDDLVRATRAALAAGRDEAARMRSAAAGYYDRELAPEAFGARLAAALKGRGGRVVIAAVNEYWSPRLFAAARDGAGDPGAGGR